MPGCHVQPEQFFNLIFGYHDGYLERSYDLSASAGANFLYGTVVPTGEVWVLNSAYGFNATRAISSIAVGVYDGVNWYNVAFLGSPAKGVGCSFNGSLPMAAGSRAFAYFVGCTAGDDLYLDLVGYKMKLVQ